MLGEGEAEADPGLDTRFDLGSDGLHRGPATLQAKTARKRWRKPTSPTGYLYLVLQPSTFHAAR